jgi:hypothetical protein
MPRGMVNTHTKAIADRTLNRPVRVLQKMFSTLARVVIISYAENSQVEAPIMSKKYPAACQVSKGSAL